MFLASLVSSEEELEQCPVTFRPAIALVLCFVDQGRLSDSFDPGREVNLVVVSGTLRHFIFQPSWFCETKWCTAGSGQPERATQMAENSFNPILANVGCPETSISEANLRQISKLYLK